MKMTVRKALTAALAVFSVSLAAVAVGGEPAVEEASSGSTTSRGKRRSSATDTERVADAKSMEEFLARALRNHPDILAAEAKLESAQAELTRTRFVITRELITLWNERNAQSESVQHLEWIRKSSGSTAVLRELIEAKGKASEIDAQVSYLLGQMEGAAARTPVAAASKRLPEGPMVEEVTAALEKPTELQFIETPIQDVAETIVDYYEITVVTDPSLKDVTVTINLMDIPLGAALQAFEQIVEGVRFVVCDYGILVTSDDSEAAATYVSANEFWRENLSQQTTKRAPPAVKAKDGAAPANPLTPPKPVKR